mmetsp:Transcript_29657/g.47766  ORF Transcript_29657/g.47766 Transcript_29657/m.47766 type:complete len:186 (+) Transcript_29657:44-601(+)
MLPSHQAFPCLAALWLLLLGFVAKSQEACGDQSFADLEDADTTSMGTSLLQVEMQLVKGKTRGSPTDVAAKSASKPTGLELLCKAAVVFARSAIDATRSRLEDFGATPSNVHLYLLASVSALMVLFTLLSRLRKRPESCGYPMSPLQAPPTYRRIGFTKKAKPVVSSLWPEQFLVSSYSCANDVG